MTFFFNTYVLTVISLVAVVLLVFFSFFRTNEPRQERMEKSIYDFKAISIYGEEINFEHYRGKKLLIVNTASKCGYTPQYKDLEALHQQYGDQVTVLGFPANNFLWQEPGSDETIASFCKKNYGVTFQLFSKISVKGSDIHPIYQWLKKTSRKTPTWNFCKYLISETGDVIAFYPASTKPMDPSVIEEIKK